MYNNKDRKIRANYKRPQLIFTILSKVVRNLLSMGLLFFFGYWMFLMSNMGPSYFSEVREGAFDISIRFTLLGLAGLIWLLAPIWFFWSSIRHGYSTYQDFKRVN